MTNDNKGYDVMPDRDISLAFSRWSYHLIFMQIIQLLAQYKLLSFFNMQILLNVTPNNSDKLIFTRSSSRSLFLLFLSSEILCQPQNEYITADGFDKIYNIQSLDTIFTQIA